MSRCKFCQVEADTGFGPDVDMYRVHIGAFSTNTAMPCLSTAADLHFYETLCGPCAHRLVVALRTTMQDVAKERAPQTAGAVDLPVAVARKVPRG